MAWDGACEAFPQLMHNERAYMAQNGAWKTVQRCDWINTEQPLRGMEQLTGGSPVVNEGGAPPHGMAWHGACGSPQLLLHRLQHSSTTGNGACEAFLRLDP